MTEETNVTTTPMQPVSLPQNKPNGALSILALFGDLTDIGLDPCEELPRVSAPMTKPQAADSFFSLLRQVRKALLYASDVVP